MADKIQNVVINYVANTQGLDELIAKTSKLTKEEKDLADSFDKANNEAKKQDKTIEDLSAEYNRLKSVSKNAFDPGQLKAYQDRMVVLEKEANDLGKTLKGAGDKAKDLGDKGAKSTSIFESGIKKVGTAIIAAFAVSTIMSFGNEVLAVTSEFQKLSAVLTNTLGSSSLANRALSDIKEFAAVTPYGVAELTQSFVKLANQGFAPTTEELRKLGDLASSTGKGFDQLTEAIIDAQTGEFERLKEFGIRASKEGDKVSFTFKGVKTQTDFTNDSIRKYILSLGDLEGVSGAMAAISETLGGKISNLGDSYDTLLNTIGDGNSGVFSTAIELLNKLIEGAEYAFSTKDQLYKKEVEMYAKAGGDRILKYVNDDINTLISTNSKFNGELVNQNQLLEINIKSLERAKFEQEEDLKIKQARLKQLGEYEGFGFYDSTKKEEGDQLKKDIDSLTKSISGQQYAIDSLNVSLQGNIKAEQAASEASKKAAAERQKQADKDFKNAIDLLKQQEELAIRRGKLNGQSEAELNMVSQYYNDLRVDIYKRYGKAVGVVFEGVKLRGEELEKEYTNIVEKEIQARIKKRKDAELGVLDQSFAQEKLQTTQFYNGQLSALDQQLLNREISVKQYQEQVSALEKEYGDKSINNEIDILEAKRGVKNQEASEIIKIDQQIADLQAKLRDGDVDAFIKSEKEKTDEAKKQADERKAILNESFNIAIDLLKGFSQLEKNNNDVRLADNRAKQAQELKEVGDNEQAKAVINDKYAKQEAAIKRRQAQQERDTAIFNIALSTAQAAIKAYAQLGPFGGAVGAAIAIGFGALQLGLIASKPIPNYNKGTKSVPGIDKGYDSELALVQPGEKIFPVSTSKQYQPALDAIFDKKIPASILNGMVMNYGKLTPMVQSVKEDNTEMYLKQMISKMDKLQQVHITADKNGIKSWVREGDTETEFVNNYFRN